MDSFSFQWKLKTEVVFGWGELANIGTLAAELGRHALLVTGRSSLRKSGRLAEVRDRLLKAKVKCSVFEGIEPNPRISTIARATELARRDGCDFILAVGGGSSMDAAKAVALELSTSDCAWNYTVFHDEKKVVPELSVPLMLVPTLNATGSELNGNAVLTNDALCQKLPLSDPRLAPDIALIDPSLPGTLPWNQTANTLVDATSHILEPYFSSSKTVAVSDGITEGILKSIVECGSVLRQTPDDPGALSSLAWAGSLACCNLPGFGMDGSRYCHHVEHVLSAYTDIAHGLGLAIILPRWLRWFRDKLGRRMVKLMPVYAAGEGMQANPDPDAAIDAFENWLDSIGMKTSLTEQGITDRSLAAKMAAGLMKMAKLRRIYESGPCAMTEKELAEFYLTCF